jgi:hypothetical protein
VADAGRIAVDNAGRSADVRLRPPSPHIKALGSPGWVQRPAVARTFMWAAHGRQRLAFGSLVGHRRTS